MCLAGSKPMFSVGVCDRFAARASQGQTVRSDRTVQSGIFICRGTYTKKGSSSTCRARRKGMMNRSMGKARSSRKQRLDGARKGRPARPGNRVPRIVKARGAAVAVPANDTALEVRALDPEMVPANAVTPADVDEVSTIRPLLPESAGGAPEELELAARRSSRPPSRTTTGGRGGRGLGRGRGHRRRAAGTAKKKRGEEEPASFLAMYFRDMAELDVLRPEQEFETARQDRGDGARSLADAARVRAGCRLDRSTRSRRRSASRCPR